MLLIRETFVNKTKGYQFGSSEWYEPYTDDRGRLFKDMQREYGRCVSKMYIDSPNEKAIGWVFEKKMRYEDARGLYRDRNDKLVYRDEDYYIREVWVEVREVVNGLGDVGVLELEEVQ